MSKFLQYNMSQKCSLAVNLVVTLVPIISQLLTAVTSNEGDCHLQTPTWPAECTILGDYNGVVRKKEPYDLNFLLTFKLYKNASYDRIPNDTIERLELHMDEGCSCACHCRPLCKPKRVTERKFLDLNTTSKEHRVYFEVQEDPSCHQFIHHPTNFSSCCIYVPGRGDGDGPTQPNSQPPLDRPMSNGLAGFQWVWVSLIVLLMICILCIPVGICVFRRYKIRQGESASKPVQGSIAIADQRSVTERSFLVMYIHDCEFSKRTAEALKSILKKVFMCKNVFDPYDKKYSGSVCEKTWIKAVHDFIDKSDYVIIISSQEALKLQQQKEPNEYKDPFFAIQCYFFRDYNLMSLVYQNEAKFVCVGLKHFSPLLRECDRFFLLPTMLKELLQHIDSKFSDWSSIETHKQQLEALAQNAQQSIQTAS